jgi:hypothetical protein
LKNRLWKTGWISRGQDVNKSPPVQRADFYTEFILFHYKAYTRLMQKPSD